ncbi:Cytochrome P450 [Melia azedarach]|uniref:Cytochrome P450 n=1 Tax=Melia azedarach TaxID=155640 RepID=A0ACC1WS43_MELAZ|nr:Cytochrome P450 [Melia azedarach]
MREPIHRRLQQLSDAYGSILNFSWGIRGVLLVSYPSAIEKCLSKNDLFFANRPRLFAGKYLGYGYTSIGAASYGPLWRNMHRVTTLEFFSTKRLNQFLDIRQDEVRLLLKNLYQSSSQSFIKVQMESKLSELSFNVIMRMIAGERYFGVEVDNPEEAKRFRNIIREIFYLSEASNLADFVQFLQWMDYQAYKKRIITVQKKAYGYMQNLIDEHRKKRNFPAPLLVPHESSDDCNIGGYDVPRSTMSIINAWAIYRDLTIWENPTSFNPERYESFDGEGYKFLPLSWGEELALGLDLPIE